MLGWLKNRAWSVIKNTWEGWQAHEGFLMSAAMAYYAAFSLFPLCLVLIAILGMAMHLSGQAENAQQKLIEQVAKTAGPWMADQLGVLLAGVKSRAGLGGPIGIATLLLASIGVFLQFDFMFNRIWGTTSSSSSSTSWFGYIRTFLRDRASAFLMLMVVGAMLVAVFVANIVMTSVRTYVERLPAGDSVWRWGQFGFTVVSNSLLFTIIYKALPKAPVRWRDAFAGGTLVAIVWIVGQNLLVSFVIGSSYTAYGVVGSFIAVMIWLYYASVVLFFGAELVRALRPPAA